MLAWVATQRCRAAIRAAPAPLPRLQPGARGLPPAPEALGLQKGLRMRRRRAFPYSRDSAARSAGPLPSPAEPAASQLCPPEPRPARRPHHHHQGLAVDGREPPATSPAAELQGGRHLAGADLRPPEVLLAHHSPARGIAGAGRGAGTDYLGAMDRVRKDCGM